MTILWNRKHATEDSAYALYAEMLRSACVDHACIGGDCQMLSGWPEEPSDVSQRVDEENNILMETRLENRTKLDLDKKFYSHLRDIFRRSVVTSELYDPNINLSSDTDQTLADVSDVDYNSEVVRGPTTKMTEDANADDEGMLPLPTSSRSGSTFSPQPPGRCLRGYRIVGKTSIFYGQTQVVNGKTGYAHNDGNFRTTDGIIVGKFGDDGSLYPLGGKFLPQPKQYSGPCIIAKMVYHIQIPSMVDKNSPLTMTKSGFATTSGDFVTEDGAIVGRFEADSGLISDTAGDRVGNAFSVQDDGYRVASHRLAEFPPLQLVFTPRDEQVTEGASVRAVRRPFSEQRDELSNLVRADHAMNNIVLQERDEEGTVHLYYPSRTGRLMLSDAASQPGQNVMSRTIAVFSTDSPNLYDIRGLDNSIIASVKRADGKSPWTLANNTTDPDALEEEGEE
ncbi:hypothetical protein D6C95_02621 [Aureobasidium pullulans]|nr:hypothetical protein D6C95_02621 [Aureobasidium pullulans]